jgi:hypothetical protein
VHVFLPSLKEVPRASMCAVLEENILDEQYLFDCVTDILGWTTILTVDFLSDNKLYC